MTAAVDAVVLQGELTNPLCFARTAEGDPITSQGRVVVGTPSELVACLGNLLHGCTLAPFLNGALDTVYVTEWAAGR